MVPEVGRGMSGCGWRDGFVYYVCAWEGVRGHRQIPGEWESRSSQKEVGYGLACVIVILGVS
jgi:hypothetical protein